MKRFSSLAVFLVCFVGLLANASQIAMFLGVDPHRPPALAPARGTTPDPAPERRAEAPNRPAHLVLSFENAGGPGESEHFDSLVAVISDRLIAEDSISVIAFTEAGHHSILDRKPGSDLGQQLAEKIHHLVPVGTPTREQLESSVADALGRLELDRHGKSASAVLFISARTRSDTLSAWFDRIRSHPSASLLKSRLAREQADARSRSARPILMAQSNPDR